MVSPTKDLRESWVSGVTFSRPMPQSQGEVRDQVQSCSLPSGSAILDLSSFSRSKVLVTGVREYASSPT